MEREIRYCATEDGVSIAYCVEGSGPTLLRTANPSGTHAQLDGESKTHRELSRNFRYVSYDSRGTGLSDRGAVDFSMAAMQRDLDAVVRVACPEEFALWTFGQSAPVGLIFAASHPERLTHLLVVEGEARSGDWERAVPALGQTYRLLSELDWHVYSETTSRVILGIEDPESARATAAFLRAAIDQHAFLELSKAREHWDATDILSSITVPTLVAHDTNVLWMPSSVVQRVAAGIPARARTHHSGNSGGTRRH